MPTEQFQVPDRQQQMRIPVSPQTEQTYARPTSPPVQPKSAGNGLLYALLGGALTLLLVGGGAAAWFIMNMNQAPVANVNSEGKETPLAAIASPSISPTPGAPDETAKLKQRIAELEKQSKQPSGRDSVPIIPGQPGPANTAPKMEGVMAKANSPADGFLALRTGPSSETGERIMEIPHGATLRVLSCLKPAPGKKGRWCRVDYNGNNGWAFDGFMVYLK
jgi:hypothetical protein